MPQFFQSSSYAPTSYYSFEFSSSYSASYSQCDTIVHGGGSSSGLRSGQTFISANRTRGQDARREHLSYAGMSSMPRIVEHAYISKCYIPLDCEDPQPIPSEQFYGVYKTSWTDSGTGSSSVSTQQVNVAQVSDKQFKNSYSYAEAFAVGGRASNQRMSFELYSTTEQGIYCPSDCTPSEDDDCKFTVSCYQNERNHGLENAIPSRTVITDANGGTATTNESIIASSGSGSSTGTLTNPNIGLIFKLPTNTFSETCEDCKIKHTTSQTGITVSYYDINSANRIETITNISTRKTQSLPIDLYDYRTTTSIRTIVGSSTNSKTYRTTRHALTSKDPENGKIFGLNYYDTDKSIASTEVKAADYLVDIDLYIHSTPPEYSDSGEWFGMLVWGPYQQETEGEFSDCYRSFQGSSAKFRAKNSFHTYSIEDKVFTTPADTSVDTTATLKIERAINRPGAHHVGTHYAYGTSLVDYASIGTFSYDSIEDKYVQTTYNSASFLGARYYSFQILKYLAAVKTRTTTVFITNAKYFTEHAIMRTSKSTTYSSPISTITNGSVPIATYTVFSYPALSSSVRVSAFKAFTTTTTAVVENFNIWQVNGSRSTSYTTSTSPAGTIQPGNGYGYTFVRNWFDSIGYSATTKRPIMHGAGAADAVIVDIYGNRLKRNFEVIYETKAPGTVAFAGSFEYSDIKTAPAYTSIDVRKQGTVFPNVFEFHINHTKRAPFIGPGRQVIVIPDLVYNNTVASYTALIKQLSKSARSAEATVIYSSTTTASNNIDFTSTTRNVTGYSLTKERSPDRRSFITGEIVTSYRVTEYTTRSTSGSMYTEAAVTYTFELGGSADNNAYFSSSYARTRKAEACLVSQAAVTYGTAGDLNGFGNSLIYFPACVLRGTSVSSNNGTTSFSTKLTKIDTTYCLTLPKNNVLIFQASPLFQVKTMVGGPNFQTTPKYL